MKSTMLVSVLAIIRLCWPVFVKDVELYCQRITNEKMRNNFLSLLNKHESNRVMNISLNDLDYDSDELQDSF